MIRSARVIAAGIVLLALLVIGFRGLGPAPPLGSLLDPVHGVWAVAATARLPARAAARISGLTDSVEVLYDDRGVPHLFATTAEDAARALGFVVARDRLFQLELQTRATAGTLTELLGERVLFLDREQRALGLAWSAEREFAGLDPASDDYRTLVAYAAGVNGWIDIMSPRDLPLEYRLLNATPMRWEPVHSLYLLRRMGYVLTYRTPEFQRRRVAELAGEEAADALFPTRSPIQEPIVPGEGRYPRFNTSPLPGPQLSGQQVGAVPWGGELGGGGAVRAVGRGGNGDWEAAGSNNWVVSPSRSATGHALLSGDPHLELTLPSVWYEAHIVVRGELDVYGVTLPGSPAIIIGFNRDVAWSFTNTEADVLDYYEEVVDDADRPSRYRLDGEWRPLVVRIEQFRGMGGELIAADTIYHTHRGPMIWREGRPYSIRWTVLEDVGSGQAIYRASRARSVEQWLEVMEAYLAPPQNAIVADRGGNIAIRSTGWFPLRPGDGRGDVIRDGTTRASDWSGRWPIDRYPFALNPEQGYLASANQQPIDPALDDTYLGSHWQFSPWRALRINQLLRGSDSVTPQAMARYHTDPGSPRADLFVPAFLEAAERLDQRGQADAELLQAAALLAEWDRRYTRDNRRAVLFELAMDELEDRTWDELVPPPSEENVAPSRVATPAEAVLYRLLGDADSRWWDHRVTPDRVEDRDVILGESLRAALRRATDRYGDPDGDGWRWDGIRHTNVYHLLRLPSLSALSLSIQGGTWTLNPLPRGGTWGASWRMVVELGPEVRARTIYPGGQSGNPFSPWYDDRIPQWVNGELDSALVPEGPAALDPERIASVLILLPAN